jgi:tRNA/tmRNA/rRNA uracil-C5-methylase (TrmA/RlmC/RlmD family)
LSSLRGSRHEVEVGPVAHGGHCVARLGESAGDLAGTVVFVRHTLPGERVVVELTEGEPGDRFLRGDAVGVLAASAARVEPPCPFAGPGLCGGCDFQHVSLEEQRRLKASVVAEQLSRLAGIERDVVVEPVPGDEAGLRYRTRMRFHRAADGSLGLRKHRSREVVPVDDCRIQAPDALVLVEAQEPAYDVVEEEVHGRSFDVAVDGFWQVHRGAPGTLVDAVLDAAEVRRGDRVVDLYSGVGLFTAFLADAAGPAGAVVAVEGDRSAVEHAQDNLRDLPWVDVRHGRVDRVLHRARLGSADVVVLDPPREGAKKAVVEQVVALSPRTVVLVACDPAAYARDVGLFEARGYRLGRMRAFDLFPMTHHVECVALLESDR